MTQDSSVSVYDDFRGEMEGRMKKYRQTSPERTKIWMEPSPKHHQQSRKIHVVYYLCRNHHLEHPHFIEVPLLSAHGLYLRDVINRLNALRGKGMPSMYSWSCKRSYKTGFVWQDLSEDDLILPTQGNEYVLKGSELFEESHSDRFHPNVTTVVQNTKQLQEPTSSESQEASSPSSSMVEKERKPPQEDELSSLVQRPSSSGMSPDCRFGENPSCGGSPSLTEYRVYKGNGAGDASTQTEESAKKAKAQETCTRGVSTDDGSSEPECHEDHQDQIQQGKENSELCRDEMPSPPACSSTSSSSRKTETLESLIRAEVKKINSFRIVEEEEIHTPSITKLKASNVLMQFISCGSFSVKNHRHSCVFIPTYRPRFCHSKFPSPLFSSCMVLGELDSPSENPRRIGLRLEDKVYFSESLIETNRHKGGGDGFTTLNHSSSYNTDSACKKMDSIGDKEEADSTRSKCVPQLIKASLTKQPTSDLMKSPLSKGRRNLSAGVEASHPMSPVLSNGGSKRITEPSSVKRPSKRPDSFRVEKEKVFKIEES
ncbi:hypothetical protein HHK36_018145 [Tetracentron sinense]|uniref:SOSEKI DIX-like domain-containing protein n=1 Tax=Tetracentron sinense TaxID=13715 RepID=A0A834Z0X4_TETSI|nr:hypothetical protein HHK36_018145 [Tetracentron sinense]